MGLCYASWFRLYSILNCQVGSSKTRKRTQLAYQMSGKLWNFLENKQKWDRNSPGLKKKSLKEN